MSVEPHDSYSPIQPDFTLFQAFAERTNLIFWAADPVSYQLVYVSPHVEKVLDIPVAEWLRPYFWQNYLHAADRDRVLVRFGSAVVDQEPLSFEYRLISANGVPLWFRDRVCLVPDNGRFLLCGIMKDVTEFKTAVHPQSATPGYTSIFLEIMTLLTTNLDIQQSLSQLAARLCEIFDVTAVRILEWNPAWNIATELAQHPVGELQQAEKEADSKLLSDLIESLSGHITPQPILLNLPDTNLSESAHIHLQNHKAQTILYVPLLEQDELLGCLELIESRATRLFSENDLQLILTIARQTAIAVKRTRLFQAEARRRREAEILLDVAEFVSSSLDRDEILARVMEILRLYLDDVHNCAISLVTEDGLQLQTILSWWSNDDYRLMPKGTLINLKDTFTSQLALQSNEPIVLSDLERVPFVNEFTAGMIKKGLRSIVCIPLKIQDRPFGTLHIYHWYQPRQFFAEEIALLQGVANQTAIAIENARLFANERKQLNLSRTLQKVGALLTTSLQLDEVYEQIFDLLGQIISYDSASIFLFDEANDQFILVSVRGFNRSMLGDDAFLLPAIHIRQKINHPRGWRVLPDVLQEPAWLSLVELGSIRAWIGALLVVKGKQIGLLSLDNARPGQYNDEDGQMVAAFANQAAVAIENARLYEETMRQAKELAILNQVSQETAVSLNIDFFLEKISKTVSAELAYHIFGFIIYEAETRELRRHYSYVTASDKAKQIKIPLETSIIGQVVLSGKTYYAPNVHNDPFYYPVNENVGSEIAIPIKQNQKVIGVINVESLDFHAFSDRDIDFLTTLASNISAVLERASLYGTLRIQAESLAEQVAQRTNELKLEKERLLAILESAGEGIILTDTDAHIFYVNPAMERQSGYSKTELLSQNPRILGSDQVPKGSFSDMWRELSNQKRWVGELVNQHKDGHTYDVAVTITPIINMDGEVTGYVSVQSDITRLKEVERLKSEFIANVSHQLRTPLTNIKTYVSLLKKGKPENFPRYFSVLHHEIDRLARLIQDLLDISRLDAETAPSREVATDFYDFWELFWPPFAERAERENRRLNVVLPKHGKQGTLTVFMESYQLNKVLSRLLENALTYSNEGGEIQVAIDEKGHPALLEIKVRDEGPGIPEAERPFIFNRFFRGAAAIEAGLPGNGLGLAIVKELLNHYGGDISLESEVGVGSCFTLHLPLVSPTVNRDSQHDVA